ncbi:hypothetical protein C8J57DRAFT_298970 [Mycena rebaudengoi]|nr:hypothetical protein C8J57DRAFT_298970 [Mycena rebaudengoi]
MAALYLHNSIWLPETPEESLPRARTPSSATLQTLPTSELSHPTQPLLHSSTSESVAYLDLLSRQPTHPNTLRSVAGLSFDGDPTTMRERKVHTEKVVKRRLRRLKVITTILEVVLIIWSLYTTIRYFLAFSIYPSDVGQIFSLILAVISALSFAVLCAAALVSLCRGYLLGLHFSIEALWMVRTVLRFAASFGLLTPTLVNFALTFAWRTSSDPALDLRIRCDLDIDVVWSFNSDASCSPPAWGAWIALSIVRLLFTSAIIAIYHLSLSSYQHTRRPSQSRHRRNASSASESTYLTSPPMSGRTPLPFTPGHHPQSSLSTIASNRRSLRSSRGSSMNRLSPSPPEALRFPRTGDSPRSSDEFDPYADLPPLPPQQQQQQQQQPAPAPAPPSENDRELYSFVDRFRSLVSQISRETADAAYTPDPYAPPGLRPAAPALGYDEFGRPYPPDDHVRILNAYIRRMPTIESLGSREFSAAGSVASASLYQESLQLGGGASRPPTRTAMTDRSRSSTVSERETPSRAGSLSMGAAATELIQALGAEGLDLGELVERVRRRGSVSSMGSVSVSMGSVSGGTGGTAGTSGTGGTAHTTTSYFTASTSGTGASPLQSPIAQITEEPLDMEDTPRMEGPPSGGEAAGTPRGENAVRPPPPALRPLPRPPLNRSSTASSL